MRSVLTRSARAMTDASVPPSWKSAYRSTGSAMQSTPEALAYCLTEGLHALEVIQPQPLQHHPLQPRGFQLG